MKILVVAKDSGNVLALLDKPPVLSGLDFIDPYTGVVYKDARVFETILDTDDFGGKPVTAFRYTGFGIEERVPATMTTGDFLDYCYLTLGVLAYPGYDVDVQKIAGMGRFGSIIKAVRASDTDIIVAAVERYDGAKMAGAWYRDTTALFFTVIAAFFEDGESDALISGWPPT